jgi:hypothetical protein
MKRVPVDVSAFVRLEVIDVVAAERDGRQSLNAEGVPVWELQVLAQVAGERRPEVIAVKVATSTKPEVLAGPVELLDLRASLWSLDGRSGIAFSASEVRPLRSANGSKVKGEPVAVGS